MSISRQQTAIQHNVETVRSEGGISLGAKDRQEDHSDFSQIYRSYVKSVYRYFYQRTGNSQDTEELTATTFTKALVSFKQSEGRGTLGGWLFGIARHTLLDFQRIQSRYTQVDLMKVAFTLVDVALQPDMEALKTEQARELRQLVQQLPADQQEALVLRIFAQLSTKEVAEVLRRSEGSVKMLVHRAVSTLRARYPQEAQL